MTTSTSNPRQFSLRLLMLVVLGCCLLLGAWRLLGELAWIAASYALIFVLPPAMLRGTWLRAWLLSTLAVYGPFTAMATYTLLYVDCSHCKQTAWMLLPVGPGLLPADMGRRLLDLSRLEDGVWFTSAIAFAAVLVAVLAWLIRTRPWWWSAPAVALTLVYGAWAAAVMLAIIRS